MNQTVQESAPPVERVELDGVTWLATPVGREVLNAARAELGQASARGELTPVKANPLREIYRIGADAAGGGDCFLKRYDESSLEGRLKRLLRGPAARVEWRNLRYADSADVPVPPPLACGVARDASFLLTASCLPARNLADFLADEGWSAGTGRALARLLVAAHAAGVLHLDLHAGNVLCRPEDGRDEPRLWLVDLQKVRLARGLSARKIIGNLAVLLTGLRAWAAAEDLAEFLRFYLELAVPWRAWRGRTMDPAEFVAAVERRADRHAAGVLRSRARSILRTSRYFARFRGHGLWRGHVFLQRRGQRPGEPGSEATGMVFSMEQWRAALAKPQALIGADPGPDEQIVKLSDTGRVVRRVLALGPHRLSVFVKYYAWRWRFAVIADPFRRSRSVRAFKLGHQLLARGVSTALPLACLERRIGRFLLESVLITEAVPDSVHLEQFVTERLAAMPAGDGARVRQSLSRQLGSAIARMRRAGWVQRDMKAPNVLVQCDGDRQVRLTFIDLDGVHGGRRDPHRPLVRLNDGLWDAPGVSLADRLRVLRSYLGPETDCRPAWRAILRATLVRRRSRGL